MQHIADIGKPHRIHRAVRVPNERPATQQEVLAQFLTAELPESNPVRTRLVGRRSESNHGYRYCEEFPLDKLYTCGVNIELNPKLKEAGGNISQFVSKFLSDDPGDRLLGEFPRLREVPQGDLRNLLVMQAPHGQHELIDGFHRAVAMIFARETSSPAFVVLSSETYEFSNCL